MGRASQHPHVLQTASSGMCQSMSKGCTCVQAPGPTVEPDILCASPDIHEGRNAGPVAVARKVTLVLCEKRVQGLSSYNALIARSRASQLYVMRPRVTATQGDIRQSP